VRFAAFDAGVALVVAGAVAAVYTARETIVLELVFHFSQWAGVIPSRGEPAVWSYARISR
jgi:hypothetical protein